MTKQHICIDCKNYIIAPNPNEKMCKCDFKSLSDKTKPKPLTIAKEIENHIMWLAERDDLIRK